jgi:hypothetical protein
VLVAPGAQRRDLERRIACEEAVDDGDGGAAVGHRQLDLEAHRTEVVSPTGDAVVEVEGRDELVASGSDRAVAPLVGGEMEALVTDDHDGVEPGEAERSGGAGRCRRHHQQTVVPAGAQARNGPHGVPTEPVGDEPLASARLVERTAHRASERDAQAIAVPAHYSDLHPSADSTSGSGRQIRSATRPVQPVWWEAPSPAPLSPWKYSKNVMLSRQRGSVCRRST